MPKSESKVSHKKLTVKELFYASIRRRTYVEIGLSLIVFIFLLFFALIPSIFNLINIREKIILYSDINNRVQSKIENIKSLNHAIENKLKDEVDFIDKSVVELNHLHVIYYNLYKRAADSNVDIIGLDFKSMGEGNERGLVDPVLGKAALVIVVNGEAKDRSTLLSYLRSLEKPFNFPFVSRIDTLNVNVSRPEEKKDTNSMSRGNDNSSQIPKLNFSITINFITLN